MERTPSLLSLELRPKETNEREERRRGVVRRKVIDPLSIEGKRKKTKYFIRN